jgi:hypothetical protein
VSTAELCEVCGLDYATACKCEECARCTELVAVGSGVRSSGLLFCSDDCESSYGEAAYEAMCEDFYGGSSPQTDRERAEVSARDNWRIK